MKAKQQNKITKKIYLRSAAITFAAYSPLCANKRVPRRSLIPPESQLRRREKGTSRSLVSEKNDKIENNINDKGKRQREDRAKHKIGKEANDMRRLISP